MHNDSTQWYMPRVTFHDPKKKRRDLGLERVSNSRPLTWWHSPLYLRTQAMTLYFLSSFLDAFDGMAARYFDQSSTFGGMLDMLTDRVGTMALIMSIATFEMYKPYTWVFQLICVLDMVRTIRLLLLSSHIPLHPIILFFSFVFSNHVLLNMPDTIPIIYAYARTQVAHWAHMYSNTLGGLKHHKTIDLEKNPILHFYYQRTWLFIFCSANELVYICLYATTAIRGALTRGHCWGTKQPCSVSSRPLRANIC